ncbi:MAG: TetR/AcrR family transcriptional regulator [Bacilli bacterium]|nr:TetR/AcrR family transcriptional regulator [Bacilli bacterium]
MNKLREAQIGFIVEEATPLFFARKINEVTMSDIAKEIGIGEATLYRYFGTKANLVLMIAERLSNNVFDNYFLNIDKSLNGFQRVQQFFEAYLNVYMDKKYLFAFINSFDAFLANETDMDLVDYTNSVNQYETIFDECFDAGVKDGSIVFDGDRDTYYRSTTLALFNVCKKLAVENDLLENDKRFDPVNEIKSIIEIFLYRIQKR